MKRLKDYLPFIHQYEIIIASSIVIVIVLLLSIIFLKPNFDRSKVIFQQQEVLKKRAEKLKSKENNLLSIDYKYFQDNFIKTTQVLPESKDYVSLFTTFDNLERKVGVSLVRTDFQLGVISTTSSRLVKSSVTSAYIIPLTIEVVGSLSSLQNFVSSLSDYTGRFITLDEVQWRPQRGSGFSLTLNGKAYFYPLQNTLGSIDSALPKISTNAENILAKIAKIKIETETDADLEKVSVGKKDLFQ